MASYTIYYNYVPNDYVWIVEGDDTLECRVLHVVLEVDPDEIEGIIERKTYHLIPKNGDATVLLRQEDVVFVSLDAALDYFNDPDLTAPPTTNFNIVYTHNVNDTVWTNDVHTPVECTILQITFNVDIENFQRTTTKTYHILPLNESSETILRSENEIFDTYEEVMQYITNLILGASPTPTPTPEVTPNPTSTPAPTSDSTPTPTVTPTLTMTVTPTLTPPATPLVFEIIQHGGEWDRVSGTTASTSVSLNTSESNRVLHVWGGYYGSTDQTAMFEFNGSSVAPVYVVTQLMGGLYNGVFSAYFAIPEGIRDIESVSITFGGSVITKFIAYAVISDADISGVRSADTVDSGASTFTSHSTTIDKTGFSTQSWSVGCFATNKAVVPTSSTSSILDTITDSELNIVLFKQHLPTDGTFTDTIDGYSVESHYTFGITMEQPAA
jgi:hypothetical protein